MIVRILDFLLAIDLSVLLAVGIAGKQVTKTAFVAALILYTASRAAAEGKRVIRNFFVSTPLNPALIFFYFFTLLSVFTAVDFGLAQRIYIMRYLPYAFLFYMAAYIAQKTRYFHLLLFQILIFLYHLFYF